ncbi:hypothetical protein CTRI78_v000297 [Colletotrichum trifolii]|uniref:TLC domain-containing protein n=1 Tax=Colletotrichum trifolii TaxID=5466 RepID=A0A4R8RT19_COLTR|nr:hypothetical protein CTRI78_v000297 [Colletotrichum trifolii]
MASDSRTTGASLPKIATIEDGPLSKYLPYASLLLASSILIIVLVSNILERWVLRLVYREFYINMEQSKDERRRRSFVYYHVGAFVMLTILCSGMYPVMRFLVSPGQTLSSPMVAGGKLKLGDMLLALAQAYSAYYIFELCYRTKLASPINIAHHTGLLVIIQTSIALFGNYQDNAEATIEFYMCIFWGIFDVCVELPIFTTMIVWRLQEKNPRLRSWLAYACFAWLLLGATVETSVTIYLLHASWDRWGTAWKVITPVIFSLWISTQLYASKTLFQMARSQQRQTAQRGPTIADMGSELGLATVDTDGGPSGYDTEKSGSSLHGPRIRVTEVA